MSISKTVSGASSKLFINGRVYPYATSIRWVASTGRKEIFGIDQSTPFELSPGNDTIQGTVEVVRIRSSGGLEGAGITASERLVLQEKYFSLLLIDRTTDTVLLQIDDASLMEQSWNVINKSIMTGSFTFKGIGWSNESDST